MSTIRDASEGGAPDRRGFALSRSPDRGSGWIRAEWILREGGRRARVYELTAAGKKQLAAEQIRWHAVTSA
jgi:hypothetical protein